MELRPHQHKALAMTRESIKNGFNRPIIAAPTAFGKTVLAAQMLKNCQDRGKKGWFFCDRIKLVGQTIDKFKQFGIDFGVRQADHPLSNREAPIQIVSIQTISAMIKSHNGKLPEFDMAIVDECHISYEIIQQIAERYNNIPMIGLSATPYAKGLGKIYNNLLVPITPRELLADGYLTPIRYYAGAHVDIKLVKSANANQFSQKSLDAATDGDKDRLTGDIIKNWMKWGENSQTIAFSPTQETSKYLVHRFQEAGITAEHIDCYTKEDEREDLYEAHKNGEFKILSCSRLLNAGYDDPTVKCLIDCFPTKSVTTYAQRAGRITRQHDSKDYSIYLDHAGNFERFGYAEDIVPESLHDGEKTHKESDLTQSKDKKEAKTRECLQCHQQMQGIKCQACGYEVSKMQQMEDDGSMLVEITEGTAANRKDTAEYKVMFLSELIAYGAEKNYKQGWAAMQYKDKYGIWPNDIKPIATKETKLAKKWQQYKNIRTARSKREINNIDTVMAGE